MKIESTQKVYLDGEEYIRVKIDCFFHDVPADNFEQWAEYMAAKDDMAE